MGRIAAGSVGGSGVGGRTCRPTVPSRHSRRALGRSEVTSHVMFVLALFNQGETVRSKPKGGGWLVPK
jgi:hypothetical protein